MLNSPTTPESANVIPLFPIADFCKSAIDAKAIQDAVHESLLAFEPINHSQILDRLLEEIKEIDFRKETGLTDENEKLVKKHFLVTCIENIISTANRIKLGICIHNHAVYLFNGAYWKQIEQAELDLFLGKAAEKMGIDKFDARVYYFKEQLTKQFLSVANLIKPEQTDDTVLVNLKNGTFEINSQKQVLRTPKAEDFITYQLPFEYDTEAKAPMFQAYLNKVQPDMDRQRILAEYLGYLFIKPSKLKLEKVLLLYGSGANGKSVFYEIVYALLGGDANISSFPLQSLTDENGYYRGKIGNKLLNYASEINGKLESSIFKQLASGEPVDARLPYGEPFMIKDYAKLIFNCNELPKDVEHTNAFFRRFLIVHFGITIPDSEQDKELSTKIIQHELSGIFNWVLAGLERLLAQKNFTKSDAVDKMGADYKKQADSVLMFLDEEGYVKSLNDLKPLKELFELYRTYCNDCGYHACSLKTFSERLRNNGFMLERKSIGNVVFIKK